MTQVAHSLRDHRVGALLIGRADGDRRHDPPWGQNIVYGYAVEKRQSPRIEINAPGTIIVISRGLRIWKLIKCLVINMSEVGAYIHADSAVSDTEFYLELSEEPQTLRLCTLVRRLDNKIGVRFVMPAGHE